MAVVLVETRSNVALLRLNRPEVRNAYNTQMRDELAQILDGLASSNSHHAMVITGDERAFCAGADLREFGQGLPIAQGRAVHNYRDIFRKIRELPMVTIAAMHGHVIGAGLEMALECDLRFAARSAVFRLPESALGFLPGGSGTQLLPRAIGRGAALDMILTGEPLNAGQALASGLVSRLAEVDELLSMACETAEAIASSPAARTIKSIVADARLQHR